MKIISNILMVLGVIAIIVILAVVMGIVLYSMAPPLKNDLVPVPVSAEALKSFDQKVDTFIKQAEAAAEAKEQKQLTLTITDEEINSKIVEQLAQGELPVKQLMINFNEDICKVYAVLNNPGIKAKIGLVTQLTIQNKDIKLVVADLQVGRLPLTKPMVKQLGSIADILFKMEGLTSDLPVDITSISIEDELLTLKGVTRLE